MLDRILVVKPRDGEPFSGMLKRIQNTRLVFMKRNGASVIIDQDAILSAFEVHPRSDRRESEKGTHIGTA